MHLIGGMFSGPSLFKPDRAARGFRRADLARIGHPGDQRLFFAGPENRNRAEEFFLLVRVPDGGPGGLRRPEELVVRRDSLGEAHLNEAAVEPDAGVPGPIDHHGEIAATVAQETGWREKRKRLAVNDLVRSPWHTRPLDRTDGGYAEREQAAVIAGRP